MKSIEIQEVQLVSDAYLRERWEEGKRPGTREFVALIDGEEAGLLIFEHFANNALGFVYEINVIPKFRARGVGNLLLLRAESEALGSACNTLRLFVRSLDQEFINDESLMSWYGRKGFDRDTSDPNCMQKTLVST